MFLFLAAVFFGIFALNVALGSFGGSSFMGDVPEMLTLFAATVAFVAAILKSEAKAREKTEKEKS